MEMIDGDFLNLLNLYRRFIIHLLLFKPRSYGRGSGVMPDPGWGPSGMQQGGYSDQGDTPPQGCVLMVYGLCPDQMNCDKIFNLFCLYGNVCRVRKVLLY